MGPPVRHIPILLLFLELQQEIAVLLLNYVLLLNFLSLCFNRTILISMYAYIEL